MDSNLLYMGGQCENRTHSVGFAVQPAATTKLTILVYFYSYIGTITTNFAHPLGFEPRTTLLESGMIPFQYGCE